MAKIESDVGTFLQRLGVEVSVCSLCGGLADEQLPGELCERCIEQGYLIEDDDIEGIGQSEDDKKRES